MGKQKYIWMKVTRDVYQLPIATADTVNELAKMLGVTRGTILKSIARSAKSGDLPQYVKVPL